MLRPVGTTSGVTSYSGYMPSTQICPLQSNKPKHSDAALSYGQPFVYFGWRMATSVQQD